MHLSNWLRDESNSRLQMIWGSVVFDQVPHLGHGMGKIIAQWAGLYSIQIVLELLDSRAANDDGITMLTGQYRVVHDPPKGDSMTPHLSCLGLVGDAGCRVEQLRFQVYLLICLA